MSIGETSSALDPQSEDVIFELRGVSVTFGMDRGQAVVLDDIDINIHRDEVLGVVGESGCGKSMFAGALLDAIRDPGQVSGEILYHPRDGDSFDVLSLSQGELKQFRWHEVAMVFQGAMSSFNPTMKIKDHFVETINAHNEDREERMEYARELMEELYLSPDRVLEAYPHELSGGMTQRALIALAMLLEPEVLIMDEPTSALDMLMQRTIISMMATLKEEHDLTLIFVTHDMPIVSGLADRLSVMYAFEIAELGPANNVILDAKHPYTRALLRSVPNAETPIEDLEVIEGRGPDPINVPNGCSYHPRCPLADDRCEAEDPDLAEVEEDHWAACFYWDQSDSAVPYEIRRQDWGEDE